VIAMAVRKVDQDAVHIILSVAAYVLEHRSKRGSPGLARVDDIDDPEMVKLVSEIVVKNEEQASQALDRALGLKTYTGSGACLPEAKAVSPPSARFRSTSQRAG